MMSQVNTGGRLMKLKTMSTILKPSQRVVERVETSQEMAKEDEERGKVWATSNESSRNDMLHIVYAGHIDSGRRSRSMQSWYVHIAFKSHLSLHDVCPSATTHPAFSGGGPGFHSLVAHTHVRGRSRPPLLRLSLCRAGCLLQWPRHPGCSGSRRTADIPRHAAGYQFSHIPSASLHAQTWVYLIPGVLARMDNLCSISSRSLRHYSAFCIRHIQFSDTRLSGHTELYLLMSLDGQTSIVSLWFPFLLETTMTHH